MAIRTNQMYRGIPLAPRTAQFAHDEAVSVIHKERPAWNSAMVDTISWDILRRIDWNNPALMHKDFKWIVKQYLNRHCPQTK